MGNSLTAPVLGCGVPVLDISHWQRSVDFDKLAASPVKGLIHKATQGTRYSKVRFFTDRAAAAAEIDLPFGSYHYATCRPGQARAEARYYASVLADTPTQLPPVLDFEERDEIGRLGRVGAAHWINEFIDELNTAGYERCVIYTCGYAATRSQIEASEVEFEGLDFWFPYYASGKSEAACRRLVVQSGGDVQVALDRKQRNLPGWPEPVMWQWTSSGKIAAIGGRVDINVVDRNWWSDVTSPAPQPFGAWLDPSLRADVQFERDLAEAKRLGLTRGIGLDTETVKKAAVMALRASKLN